MWSPGLLGGKYKITPRSRGVMVRGAVPLSPCWFLDPFILPFGETAPTEVSYLTLGPEEWHPILSGCFLASVSAVSLEGHYLAGCFWMV